MTSSAQVEYDETQGTYSIQQQGLQANLYREDDGSYSGCAVNFSDPTADMIQTLDELAFRTALNMPPNGDASPIRHFAAQQANTVLVFESHYEYLIAAYLVTFFSILIIAGTFDRWWILGRNFSLSPIEIAVAFEAPMLRDVDSNAPERMLVKQLGEKRVKYGEVVRHMESGGEQDSASTHAAAEHDRFTTTTDYGPRLAMADPGMVRRPVVGRIFRAC